LIGIDTNVLARAGCDHTVTFDRALRDQMQFSVL
jgi:hypothetical protein